MAYRNGYNVKHDTVEVEVRVCPKLNVVAIVTEERGTDAGIRFVAKEADEQCSPLPRGVGRIQCVQCMAEGPSSMPLGGEFRVARVIGVARQHLLFLGSHGECIFHAMDSAQT